MSSSSPGRFGADIARHVNISPGVLRDTVRRLTCLSTGLAAMTKGSSHTARNDVTRLSPGTQRGGCGKRVCPDGISPRC
jgi:hypothetical protein